MAKFKVGDRIVRDSSAGHSRFGVVLEEGKAYTVASIDYEVNRLSLVEFPSVGPEWSASLWTTATRCRMSAHKEAYRAAARANDPVTSKGKRKVNKYEEAVLDILKGLYKDQGYTGKQIASLTGHPLNCITPRFAPLRRKGLIKDSGIKRDKQIVWVLA